MIALFRRGPTKPNVGMARHFVEAICGRGTGSAKITTKANVFDGVYRKLAVKRHGVRLPTIPFDFWSGGELELRGRKSIVFLNRKPALAPDGKAPTKQELERTLVHELFHTAFRRVKKRVKKKFLLLANEVFAYLGEFEFLAESNMLEYQQMMREHKKDAIGKFYTMRAISVRTGFGNEIALAMNAVFSSRERRAIMTELLGKNFNSEEHFLKFLKSKFAQKRAPKCYIKALSARIGTLEAIRLGKIERYGPLYRPKKRLKKQQ